MAGDLLAGLLAIPGNAEEYEVIKKAIAVVNLDTCAPETVLQSYMPAATRCGLTASTARELSSTWRSMALCL
ncbi:MAG: hypothetical protein ACLU9S_08370 [Oscillospiraceae bacterium]